MRKRIGLLAGFGAAAGARFFQMIVNGCQTLGANKDSDFPEIIVFSMASKGMDEKGILDERVIKRDLLKGIRTLNHNVVDVIIIACNSAYAYYDRLQASSEAPIINLPECVAEYLKGAKIGLVSSRSTVSSGIYRDLVSVYVTKNQQKTLDRIIKGLIKGAIEYEYLALFTNIVDSLLRKGADLVLIGCTELSLLPQLKRTVDAGDIAIRRMLR